MLPCSPVRVPKVRLLAAVLVAVLTAPPVASAQVVLITAPQTVTPTQTSITPTAGGAAVPLSTAEIVVNNTTLTVNGWHQIASLVLQNSATVTHTQAVSHDYLGAGRGVVYGLDLDVTSGVTVGAGCAIQASARGYPGGSGPGVGTAGFNFSGGGGHGGHGGVGASNNSTIVPGGVAYGSMTQPSTMGSGGGLTDSAGSGGGAVRLSVGGTLTLEGAIRADGPAGSTSAGAGGSVWISAQSLAGSGAITANGGSGSGAGGGGGRIAVYANAITVPVSNIHAYGGSGDGTQSRRGGAGTILLLDAADADPALILDGGGAARGGITPITGAQTLRSLTLVNGADARFNSAAIVKQPLSLTNAAGFTGTSLLVDGALTVSGGSLLSLSTPGGLQIESDLTVSGLSSVVQVTGETSLPGDLTLTGGALVTHPAGIAGLHLDVAGNVLVAGAGSRIDVSGRGYPGESGPGVGTGGSNLGAGGGHGGHGGIGASNGPSIIPGGVAYGSMTQPSTMGSGGGLTGFGGTAGSGGGAVRLSVGGTLTLEGAIRADGPAGSTSAGAGGSVWISAQSLAGSGAITANGGSGSGAGGGGGRIAVYANAITVPVSNIHAYGGSGDGQAARRGGAGTVLLLDAAEPDPALILDGGGSARGGITPITGAQSLRSLTLVNGADARFSASATVGSSLSLLNAAAYRGTSLGVQGAVTVESGSLIALTAQVGLSLESSLSITGPGSTVETAGTVVIPGDLSVLSGGVLTHPANSGGITLNVAGSAVISGGGSRVDVSGRGYPAAGGPGAGGNSGSFGAGGGHGGRGGSSAGNNGGATYGSATQPVAMGSGAGLSGFGATSGSGGGAVRLIVAQTLTLDGAISANAPSNFDSCGAGGSIWITAQQIVGSGTLSANGGSNASGVGGGGGRIAVYTCSSTLPPQSISAVGGTGVTPSATGQAGTIYLESFAASITSNPADETICPTGTATFTIGAGGQPTLAYRWQREAEPGVFVDLADGPSASWDGGVDGIGAIVEGAATEALTITADTASSRRIAPVHAVRYRCVVSNGCNTVVSDSASLRLCPPDFNCDNFSDALDYDAFISAWLVADLSSDINADGFSDALDYDLFINAWLAGC